MEVKRQKNMLRITCHRLSKIIDIFFFFFKTRLREKKLREISCLLQTPFKSLVRFFKISCISNCSGFQLEADSGKVINIREI